MLGVAHWQWWGYMSYTAIPHFFGKSCNGGVNSQMKMMVYSRGANGSFTRMDPSFYDSNKKDLTVITSLTILIYKNSVTKNFSFVQTWHYNYAIDHFCKLHAITLIFSTMFKLQGECIFTNKINPCPLCRRTSVAQFYCWHLQSKSVISVSIMHYILLYIKHKAK